MASSGTVWRDTFARNLAIGYAENGKPLGHKKRTGVRAAGSLDTTIGDVLILSNSSNAESLFMYAFDATLGKTGFPWL
jgi:hypothetical protein